MNLGRTPFTLEKTIKSIKSNVQILHCKSRKVRTRKSEKFVSKTRSYQTYRRTSTDAPSVCKLFRAPAFLVELKMWTACVLFPRRNLAETMRRVLLLLAVRPHGASCGVSLSGRLQGTRMLFYSNFLCKWASDAPGAVWPPGRALTRRALYGSFHGSLCGIFYGSCYGSHQSLA